MKNGEIPHTLIISDEHVEMKNWLLYLCLDKEKFYTSEDFTCIREKPLFQFENNRFIFLNINFLFDKIFEGIKFDYSASLMKNDAVIENVRIKSFPDFKRIYSEKFTEKSLFYPLMEYLFQNRTYLELNGDNTNVSVGEPKPDFYIRSGKYIFIFEFKDVLFNSRIKHSLSFPEISG